MPAQCRVDVADRAPCAGLQNHRRFRRDNGAAICAACAQFIVICRNLGLFTRPVAAIDGSKFKGVNARDKNFTRGKVKTRLAHLNETIARYLTALDAADRQESMGVESGSKRLRDRLVRHCHVAEQKRQVLRIVA